MFCPKCGSPNQDDIAYCRECGENLQVVSQAIKGHLSVALVSKIDAVIETKNERFRRDAILNGLMGIAFLFAGVFKLFVGAPLVLLNVVWVLVSVFALIMSAWKFLDYRRGLELRSRPLPREDAIAASKNYSSSVYCPRCGLENANAVAYCPSCGTDLDLILPATGMERYLPQFLIKKIDADVAKNEATPFKPQYKSGTTLFAISALFLFSAVMGGINRDWSSVVTNVAIGLSLVVSGGWNLIAYRRDPEIEKRPSDNAPVPIAVTLTSYMSFNWKMVVPVVAIAMGALFYFGLTTGFPIALFGLVIVIASFLRFRGQQTRRQYPQDDLSPTLELSSQDALDTRRLQSPPAGVTETTTKVLEPLAIPLDQEKAPTTRELVDPR